MQATRLILQKSDDDCGIASLAMLFKTPYEDMRCIVLQDMHRRGVKFDGMFDTDFKEAALALGEPLKTWHAGPKNRETLIDRLEGRRAILIVPCLDIHEHSTHAVFWDGCECLDPSPGMSYPQDGMHALAVFLRALVLSYDGKSRC